MGSDDIGPSFGAGWYFHLLDMFLIPASFSLYENFKFPPVAWIAEGHDDTKPVAYADVGGPECLSVFSGASHLCLKPLEGLRVVADRTSF